MRAAQRAIPVGARALVARGAWAEEQLGRDTSELRAVLDGLLVSCEKKLSMWHRPGSEEVRHHRRPGS